MSPRAAITFWLDMGAPISLLSRAVARLRRKRVARPSSPMHRSGRSPGVGSGGTSCRRAPRRAVHPLAEAGDVEQAIALTVAPNGDLATEGGEKASIEVAPWKGR